MLPSLYPNLQWTPFHQNEQQMPVVWLKKRGCYLMIGERRGYASVSLMLVAFWLFVVDYLNVVDRSLAGAFVRCGC